MKLARFDAPGRVKDLTEAQHKAWSRFISDAMDQEINSGASAFYNPSKTDTDADVQQLTISWTAFPRRIQIMFPVDEDRWKQADASRDVQDEYCEWAVTRNASGKVTQVVFTCEGPEYWDFLARSSRAKALALYQRYVSPKVKVGDLFLRNGKYNGRNKWNISTAGGIMHLVQGANTLSAEIDIAARATIIRKINGRILTTEQELIECGGYGDPERHSDPHIGGAVNQLARQMAEITLADPVGLYIEGLSTGGWQTPDGSNPQKYWSIERGDANFILRARYEVPPQKGFVVGDIKISGRPIQFGSQIADFITMKLVGQACRFGKSQVPPVTKCEGGFDAMPEVSDMAEILEPRPPHSRHR
jgi:hypothetical protein